MHGELDALLLDNNDLDDVPEWLEAASREGGTLGRVPLMSLPTTRTPTRQTGTNTFATTLDRRCLSWKAAEVAPADLLDATGELVNVIAGTFAIWCLLPEE